MNRKGKAFLSAVVLIIFSIQLLLSTKIANSQTVGTYCPTGYNVRGATAYISGALTDLQSDNTVYMTFGSYFSGTDTSDFVDNDASDIDSSADKGTHGNFSEQQYGPDSICDALTEGNTSVTVNSWGIASSASTGTSNHLDYRYMGGMSPDVDNMTVTKLHIRYGGTGIVAIALYTGGTLTDPTGAIKRTEAYNVAVSAGWNEIDVPDVYLEKNTVAWIGWCHGGGNVYYSLSSADAGDFQSARGRWSQTTPSDANETVSMPISPGPGLFTDYWYAVYAEYEAPNYEMDLEVQWTNVDYDEANEELAIYVDKGNNTYSLDATGGYAIVGDGTPDWGSTTGTISFWVKMDTSVQGRFWGQDGNMETRWSGTNLVLDWGGTASMTSAYSFSADKWYFVAIVWDEINDNLFLYVGDEINLPTLDSNSLSGTWTSTTPAPTQNLFLNGLGGNEPVDGHGDDLRYWNIARSQTQIQSDYNTELTGSEANLRSYFKLNNNFDDIGPDNNDGSGSGSYSFSSDVPFDRYPTEKIQVDVWNGITWQNLFTELTGGWNNISVSSYLDSSTFAIRFRGETETGDVTQDVWNIDATLLHVWSNEYTTEVEFTGSSDTETWNRLDWSVGSAWTVDSISVTLQLYNYSLGDYSSSGNGYVTYTSSVTANTDETKNQTITVSPTHFRNTTGYWKVKVKGVKMTDAPFDFKANLINYRIQIPSQPFGWVTPILYALPVVSGFLFIVVVKFRRKKKTETFSESFGMTHQQMIGKKMLLEIDPTSDYHKALFNFASEARNSSEPLFIFTGTNSALHSSLPKAENVKFFLLTSNASYLQQINDMVILLPAHDLSVLLNASVEVLKIQKEKTINMLFDNISSIIIRCGFEETYNFLHFLLEAVDSPKATVLFVFNPAAHDPVISSSIRGLFHNQFAYSKSGPKVGAL